MIKLLYIDLFCGAGGTTTGVENARYNGEKCAKVIACVNHDPNAIASHAANHPEAIHFNEDIRTLNIDPLKEILEFWKRRLPLAKVVLWASLECTNFSRAKGGMPRNADSRTLAEHLYRYIYALNPDIIQIENVEEFMCWGKLDDNGKPVSRHKGAYYLKWVRTINDFGYTYAYKILNAADYGAYTSRKRLFGQFVKKGLQHAFPIANFSKTGDKSDNLFGIRMYKWKPVREVLDLNDDGESIFTRKKTLCEKTLKRIFSGLIKFVAGGKDSFLIKYNSMCHNGNYTSPGIDDPCPTVTCQNRLGLVKCQFLSKQFSGDDYSGVGIRINDNDSEMTVKIKEFMASYGIIDIRMRMLKISELKAIMGFPLDYVLVGTQSEQKKFIGNSVEVNMSRKLCEALAEVV